MPDDYTQMMKKCWDADPSKSPTIWEFLDFVMNKLEEIYEGKIDFSDNDNNNISSGSNSSSNSPQQQVHEKHSLAYHTSRILDEEITKLNLKSNDSLLSDLDINSII